MSANILLTSFNTWLPHHKSNSADDLLQEISNTDVDYACLTFLRRLPVDTQVASTCVINQLAQQPPTAIICCGMAENRTRLTVESNATCQDTVLRTYIDLNQLITGLLATDISHEAGKFVCEGLYFSVLNYLHEQQLNYHCIFVHVPIITKSNLPTIKTDFLAIIQKMAHL